LLAFRPKLPAAPGLFISYRSATLSPALSETARTPSGLIVVTAASTSWESATRGGAGHSIGKLRCHTLIGGTARS